MPTSRRIAVAALLLVLAGLAVVFLGGGVGSCLGPLGVTTVQCIHATGITPAVGLGAPLGALALVAAILLLRPGTANPRWRFAGASIGAVAGAFAYLALRQSSMTGASSTGDVITVTLLVDSPALVAVAILAAGAGWLLGGWARSFLVAASA